MITTSVRTIRDGTHHVYMGTHYVAGSARVTAHNDAIVYASESANIMAWDRSTIYASGDAWVCMAEDFTGTVTLVNNATSRPERYATYNED